MLSKESFKVKIRDHFQDNSYSMLCVSIIAPGAAVVMLTLDRQRAINKTLFYTKNKSRMKLVCV